MSYLVMDRIQVRENEVFTPKDFLDLGSRAAIDQALSRLVTSGQLRRVSRGFYDFPRYNKVLKGYAPPSLDAIIEAIRRRDKIQLMPNGIVVANNLGLTNAVPARPSYISSGKTKTVQVGKRTVYFQHVSQKVIAWADRPGGQFVSAVLWLGKAIASESDTVNLMRVKLPDDVKQDLLQNLDLLPSWMASIARNVCYKTDLLK